MFITNENDVNQIKYELDRILKIKAKTDAVKVNYIEIGHAGFYYEKDNINNEVKTLLSDNCTIVRVGFDNLLEKHHTVITIPLRKRQLGYIIMWIITTFSIYSVLTTHYPIKDANSYHIALELFCMIYLTILGVTLGMLGCIYLVFLIKEKFIENKIGFKK